jgi:protein ImuB
MRRFMSFSLPRWPTQRPTQRRSNHTAASGDGDHPFALVHTTTGGERLYALNTQAARRGLRRGQALADAKALEPDLRIAPAAPEADRKLLQALARWCGRWSPWTAPDPGQPGTDGVLLDITGCARLFGGEDKLVANAIAAVRDQGLTARAAIAPTLGLAWGLARYAAPREASGWIRVDQVEEALNALPVEALRIGDTAATLRRFGLKRVGDIAALPRANLVRRFGRDLSRRLDQARGIEEEVLSPLQHKTAFRSRLRFPEALLLLENIKQAVRETANTLCKHLDGEGQGLRRVELHLYRVDGKTHLLLVGTAAPARDPAHIARLFNEKLDRAEIDIGFGIDVVELCATHTENMSSRQSGLIAENIVDLDGLAQLTDRLSVRLGSTHVKQITCRQSHTPERAAGWKTGGPTGTVLTLANPPPTTRFEPQTAPAKNPATLPPLERPLLVLSRPEPAEAVAEIPDGPPRSFVWRRTHHQVSRAEGPERLAPEWWLDQLSPRTRDYFSVETIDGRRFWLYREGLYSVETNQPHWFVHGAS